MLPIKEFSSASHASWCPVQSHRSYIALGYKTRNRKIDFVDINLKSLNRNEYETKASLELDADAQLSCLSWSATGDAAGTAALGRIGGGFNDGVVRIWDPSEILRKRWDERQMNKDEKLAVSAVAVSESPKALTATLKYNQPVSCLSFNDLSHASVVACGYEDGMLNIVNLAKQSPLSPSSSSDSNYDVAAADSIKAHGNSCVHCVSWNTSVLHILASASDNGMTTIWDLRQRKPSIRFKDSSGRIHPSSLAWLPNQSTQLIVAYDDDSNPTLQIRELRNASVPLKEFAGHTRGITDVHFMELDTQLMLSTGKDCRIVCWAFEKSPSAYQPLIYSEISVAGWQNTIRASPCIPALVLSCSHSEGVSVHSVQTKRNPAATHVPRWCKKPAGVSFGFGGKFASFGDSTGASVDCSIVSSTEADLVHQADEFESILLSRDYLGYCRKRIRQTDDENERLMWEIVESVFVPPGSKAAVLTDKLGFPASEVVAAVESFIGMNVGSLLDSVSAAAVATGEAPHPDRVDSKTGDSACSAPFSSSSTDESYSNIRGGIEDLLLMNHHSVPAAVSAAANAVDDAESFYANLGSKGSSLMQEADWERNAEGSTKEESNEDYQQQQQQSSERDKAAVLSVPAAAAGAAAGAKARSVVSKHSTPPGGTAAAAAERDDGQMGVGGGVVGGAAADVLMKKAMIVGLRGAAVEVCIKANRWADAMLLAFTSGEVDLWEKTKNLYIKHKSSDNKFIQLVSCIITQSFDSIVKQSDLYRWEESLALLATYSPAEMFSSLACQLGQRLERDIFDVRAAVVCYVAAGDFPRAASIWSSTAAPAESGRTGTAQKQLQDLVEKLTVLKKATNYNVNDELFSDKVNQYAEILANSGRLLSSMKFLCLVESDYCSSQNAFIVLMDRIYNAAPLIMQMAGIEAPPSFPFHQVDVVAAVPLQQQQQQQQLYTQQTNQQQLYMQPNQPAFVSSKNQIPYQSQQPSYQLQQPSFPLYGASHQQQHSQFPQPLPSPTTAPPPWGLQSSSLSQTLPPSVASSATVSSNPFAISEPSTATAPTYIPHSTATATAAAAQQPDNPNRQRYVLTPSYSSMPIRQPPLLLQLPQQQQQQQHFMQQQPPASAVVPPASNFSTCCPPVCISAVPSTQRPPSDSSFLYSSASPSPHSSAGTAGVVREVFRLPPSQQQQQQQPVSQQGEPLNTLHQQQQSVAAIRHHHQQQQQQPALPPKQSSMINQQQQLPILSQQQAAMMSHQQQQQLQPAFSRGPGPAAGSVPAAFPLPLPVVKSTAPTAGVVNLPQGMPVPWPIPTGTQQVGSTTQSTAPANQKIQSSSVESVDKIPMSTQNVAFVKGVLTAAVSRSAQFDASAGSRDTERLRQAIDDLIQQLQSASISKAVQELLLQYCRALDVGDSATANQLQLQMVKLGWSKESRVWLPTLKRLQAK